MGQKQETGTGSGQWKSTKKLMSAEIHKEEWWKQWAPPSPQIHRCFKRVQTILWYIEWGIYFSYLLRIKKTFEGCGYLIIFVYPFMLNFIWWFLLFYLDVELSALYICSAECRSKLGWGLNLRRFLVWLSFNFQADI